MNTAFQNLKQHAWEIYNEIKERVFSSFFLCFCVYIPPIISAILTRVQLLRVNAIVWNYSTNSEHHVQSRAPTLAHPSNPHPYRLPPPPPRLSDHYHVHTSYRTRVLCPSLISLVPLQLRIPDTGLIKSQIWPRPFLVPWAYPILLRNLRSCFVNPHPPWTFWNDLALKCQRLILAQCREQPSIMPTWTFIAPIQILTLHCYIIYNRVSTRWICKAQKNI